MTYPNTLQINSSRHDWNECWDECMHWHRKITSVHMWQTSKRSNMEATLKKSSSPFSLIQISQIAQCCWQSKTLLVPTREQMPCRKKRISKVLTVFTLHEMCMHMLSHNCTQSVVFSICTSFVFTVAVRQAICSEVWHQIDKVLLLVFKLFLLEVGRFFWMHTRRAA